jgi:hypothetical protein
MTVDAPAVAAPLSAVDTFWYFAAARHRVYMCRIAGHTCRPDDWILRTFRFTNAFRACDRVSQYLIRNVQYGTTLSPDEAIFRTLLFKLFNRVETWQALSADRPQSIDSFSVDRAAEILLRRMERGERVYSAAYIVPPVPGTAGPKHAGHLALVARMLDEGLPGSIRAADSLEETFYLLRSYPGIGNFLAFQLAVDISYSSAVSFDDGGFVKAGPGALDGIAKCFPDVPLSQAETLIQSLCERQEEEFDARGLHFDGLHGRPLQPVDVQNLFCEVSKYTRAAIPDLRGTLGRTRIKQRYAKAGALPAEFFPPKWGLSFGNGSCFDLQRASTHIHGDDPTAHGAQAVEGSVAHEDGLLPLGW